MNFCKNNDRKVFIKKAKLICIYFLLLATITNAQKTKYLGFILPLETPEVFAPGTISVDSTGEAMISVTKNGSVVYFPRYFKDENGRTNGVKSFYTRFDGAKWTDLKLKDSEQFYRTPRFVNDTLAIMASKGCIWQSSKVNESVWTKPSFVDSLDLSRRSGVSDWTITEDLTIFFVQNGKVLK